MIWWVLLNILLYAGAVFFYFASPFWAAVVCIIAAVVLSLVLFGNRYDIPFIFIWFD